MLQWRVHSSLFLSAVTPGSRHWRHCYSSWTNLCWKLGILTSHHGLLQISSQREATNAQCFFSKMNPWSNLSIIICRNFQVANLKSSTETYTPARLISSPAQLEHMFWVCVCVCLGVGHIQGVQGGMDKTSGECSLCLNYTDITQNTYIQSWTVTEIMAREAWNFDSYYTLIDYQIHIKTGRNMWFL